MDDSWVCYDELGVWCNFNILWLDSWPCSPIFGEMGKLCQILSKIWWCLHLALCHKQMAQHIETGKYSFVWGIIALHFGENYASLLLPISEEAWQIVQVSWKSITHFTVVHRWRRNPTATLLLWRTTWYFQPTYLDVFAASNALTLLVGRQEGHPSCKTTEWWGAGVVICLERGADLPSWCHCHWLSLTSVKSRLVLPFWYQLTRVVPDKGPLNGCCCVT